MWGGLPSAGEGLSLVGEFRLSDFTMRPHQSFLAKSAHLMYYVLRLSNFIEIGTSDLLFVSDHFKEIGTSDLLLYIPQSGRWMELVGGACVGRGGA